VKVNKKSGISATSVTPGQDYKNLSEKKAPDVGLIVDNEGESMF
jgi:hypothetical protein